MAEQTIKVHFPEGTAWMEYNGPCDATVSIADARLLVAGGGGVTLCEGEEFPPDPPPDAEPPAE